MTDFNTTIIDIDADKMPAEIKKLYLIMLLHTGKPRAISMLDLYELFNGVTLERHHKTKKPVQNVATLSRSLRFLIDDLRDVYGLPVVGDSSCGYYIISNQDELIKVLHQYKSRGIKSLQTAARISKISLVDTVAQLALELTDSNSEINKKVRSTKLDDNKLGDLVLSKSAKMAVISNHLAGMLDDPETHAEQLEQLREAFGPRLLPKKVLNQLDQNMRDIQQLAQQNSAMLGEV